MCFSNKHIFYSHIYKYSIVMLIFIFLMVIGQISII